MPLLESPPPGPVSSRHAMIMIMRMMMMNLIQRIGMILMMILMGRGMVI